MVSYQLLGRNYRLLGASALRTLAILNLNIASQFGLVDLADHVAFWA